jgi:cytochrome c oxidase assembly protein subunit 15
MARGLLLLLLLQIIFGAFVAGLKAGLVYNTFPKMGSYWVAEGVTALTPLWKNFTEGLAGVQFAHRYLAYAVACLAIIIATMSYRLQFDRSQTLSLYLLLCLLIIQFVLGVFTLLYSVPITLGVLHQAFGLLLFGSVIVFNQRITNA